MARIRRALWLGWRAAGRGVVEFYHSDNLTFAASIAYYSLLSFFPFFLLILSILSKLAVGAGETSILTVLQRALPSNFEFIVKGLDQLAAAPLQLTVAGTIFTLWASMGVFSAVTSAVNHAWGVEKPHGFFKQKLIAFIMLSAASLLMMVALFLVSTVEVVQATWFAGVVERYPGLYKFSGMVFRNAPTVLFILVLGLIYYWVPNAQVRLRDVWFGAVLAGLLWRLTFSGFSWYMSVARFNVHRDRDGRRVPVVGVSLGRDCAVRRRSDRGVCALAQAFAGGSASRARARRIEPRTNVGTTGRQVPGAP